MVQHVLLFGARGAVRAVGQVSACACHTGTASGEQRCLRFAKAASFRRPTLSTAALSGARAISEYTRHNQYGKLPDTSNGRGPSHFTYLSDSNEFINRDRCTRERLESAHAGWKSGAERAIHLIYTFNNSFRIGGQFRVRTLNSEANTGESSECFGEFRIIRSFY